MIHENIKTTFQFSCNICMQYIADSLHGKIRQYITNNHQVSPTTTQQVLRNSFIYCVCINNGSTHTYIQYNIDVLHTAYVSLTVNTTEISLPCNTMLKLKLGAYISEFTRNLQVLDTDNSSTIYMSVY